MLAEQVMGDAALAADPKFAKLIERVKHRAETDGKVAAAFATMDVEALSQKLEAADIAFARVNDVAGLHRASASAAHQCRYAARPGVLSGAGADPREARSYGRDAGAGRAYREGAEGVLLIARPRKLGPSRRTRSRLAGMSGRCHSITSLRAVRPRSEAVEPITNTNGIDSDADHISSMKSLA